MPETATITLAGVPYEVPRLNFGQRKRIASVRAETFGYDLLAIALERANPRPAKFDEIEATQEEITAAFEALNRLNGFERRDGAPGEAEAPAAATQAGAS